MGKQETQQQYNNTGTTGLSILVYIRIVTTKGCQTGVTNTNTNTQVTQSAVHPL